MTSPLMFIGGLAALVIGASLLVRGACRLALALSLPPLAVVMLRQPLP